jgi:hypothetical protein
MEPRRSPDRPPRWRRRGLWVLGAVLLLLVAARLALDPYAAWRTREALAGLEGYRGEFSSVSVSVLRLSYSVEGLKLLPEQRRGAETRVSFRAKRIEIALAPGELVRRRVRAFRVEVDDPKVEVQAAGGGGGKKRWDAELRDRLSREPPRAYQRIQVRRAEIGFSDESSGTPAVRLRDLDLAVENVPTKPQLAKGEPTLLAASGTLQSTAQVSVFVTADPFTRRLSFAGSGAVERLELRELAGVLERKTDFLPEKGTVDVFARFHAREGRLSGGVKPVLKDVEVKPARPGTPALKAWLTDAALKISSRVPRRDATGVIPIQGDLTDPKTDLWTAVWAVLRNAFAAGIESGLAEQPREKSPGPAPQARTPPLPRTRARPGPVEPGHPPLAEAPEELFVPGAVERIQKALAERGYLELDPARQGRIDPATTVAVRKFQSDQRLARTGIPDHETVRRMDLDPDALFRKAKAAPDPGR